MGMITKASYFVGLMSGTSLDGIDAALVELQGNNVRLVAFDTYPLPEKLKEPILRLNVPGYDEIDAMGMLDRALGRAFAEAALAIIEQSNLKPDQITAIGSHGQTIRHRPYGLDNSDPYTLQIGCAATIAEKTGITTVSDFRSRDIAASGQGAPLVPFVHQQLFAEPDKNVAVLNIGGIANITYLANSGEVLGFDTGPGNMVMDGLMQVMTDARFTYDAGGELASMGQVNLDLLNNLLAHDFFKQTPPRSTGREDFGAHIIEQVMGVDISDADKMATVCELTAQSIVDAIAHLPATPDAWLVCGGGNHNTHLLSRLEALLAPKPVMTTTEVGLLADAVEAVAFAILAKHTLFGEVNTLAAVTGAFQDVCGGQITPGKNWKSIY